MDFFHKLSGSLYGSDSRSGTNDRFFFEDKEIETSLIIGLDSFQFFGDCNISKLQSTQESIHGLHISIFVNRYSVFNISEFFIMNSSSS